MSYFENFAMYRKHGDGIEGRIYPNHFPPKNENQAFRLGVESRIVKISVFPQNGKTMSYD